ncbi:MAG: hypothetical protein ACKO38_04230 [Planctomycetota bacterium]
MIITTRRITPLAFALLSVVLTTALPPAFPTWVTSWPSGLRAQDSVYPTRFALARVAPEPAQIAPVPTGADVGQLPPPREQSRVESPRGPFMPEERPITSLSAAIGPKTDQVPPDFAQAHFGSATMPGDGRPWHDTLYFWEPPALCHRPLYFEEANLERYGYGVRPVFQPAVSGARFLATTAALPYLMTAQSPRDCVYTLGRDRPGSLAPRRPHYPELRPGAAAAEAGVAAGLILLIP